MIAKTAISPHISLQQVLNEEFAKKKLGTAATFGLVYRKSGRAQTLSATSGEGNYQSIFDLASISKTLLALTAGVLHSPEFLTQPLGEIFKPSQKTPAEQVSLHQLLSHRAGLPAHEKFYRPTFAGLPISLEDIVKRCMQQCDKRVKTEKYSDLGYILAARVLVNYHKKSLDQLLAESLPRNLKTHIGSAGQYENWLGHHEFKNRTITTEYSFERGAFLKGRVHDHNSWAISGKSWSGHAGLFSDLPSLLELAKHLLDGARGKGVYGAFLPEFLKPTPGGSFLIGFDGKSLTGSQAGHSASSTCFGHLGFTGTSIWIDPEYDAASVLLSNRVAADWAPQYIRASRKRLHSLGFEIAQNLPRP